MIVVGIDPGLTGAIAFLGLGKAKVFDLPIVPLGGNGMIKNRVYGPGLKELILGNCPAGEPVMVVVENVATMGGQNNAVQIQGSLMRTKGTIETVIELLGYPVHEVNSQTWKGFYGLINSAWKDSERKKKSLECARRMWPSCADISLAKHHNKAEALLIANYGLRKLT